VILTKLLKGLQPRVILDGQKISITIFEKTVYLFLSICSFLGFMAFILLKLI
jgi:hypothetical protein